MKLYVKMVDVEISADDLEMLKFLYDNARRVELLTESEYVRTKAWSPVLAHVCEIAASASLPGPFAVRLEQGEVVALSQLQEVAQ